MIELNGNMERGGGFVIVVLIGTARGRVVERGIISEGRG